MTSAFPGSESRWFNRLRVEHLVCISNDILPDRDQSILHELLEEAQGELDSLHADISHLETVLAGLKRRQALGIQRVTRLRSGFAPHKRLPPEILAKIFVESGHGETVSIPRLPDMRCVTWDLGGVCMRWRDIGRVQLEIYPTTHHNWTILFDLVATYSSRLWKLDLQFDHQCLDALSRSVKAFDSLESVSLTCPLTLAIPEAHILAFSKSRNVRAVTLAFDDYSRLTFHLKTTFHWAQLSDLTLRGRGIGQNSRLFILNLCPELVHLIVELIASHDIEPQTRESPILLAHLQSICIYLGTALGDLLSHLALPSLTNFHIDGKKRRVDLAKCVSLIETSGYPISSVKIVNTHFDTEFLVPAMRALPTLIELVIETPTDIPDSILSVIQTEGLAPNLRKFEGCGFSSVYSAIEFMNSRWSRTASGNYDGLQDFMFWLYREDYPAVDREYFGNMLTESEKQGRRIRLMLE